MPNPCPFKSASKSCGQFYYQQGCAQSGKLKYPEVKTLNTRLPTPKVIMMISTRSESLKEKTGESRKNDNLKGRENQIVPSVQEVLTHF